MRLLKVASAAKLLAKSFAISIVAIPLGLIIPAMVQQAHATDCAAFNLNLTVTNASLTGNFEFKAGRVITFNFDLQPGQTMTTTFLGVTKNKSNTGGVTQSYQITYTVPNTGATSSGAFDFLINGGAAVQVTGSCGGGTSSSSTSTSNDEYSGYIGYLLEQYLIQARLYQFVNFNRDEQEGDFDLSQEIPLSSIGNSYAPIRPKKSTIIDDLLIAQPSLKGEIIKTGSGLEASYAYRDLNAQRPWLIRMSGEASGLYEVGGTSDRRTTKFTGNLTGAMKWDERTNLALTVPISIGTSQSANQQAKLDGKSVGLNVGIYRKLAEGFSLNLAGLMNYGWYDIDVGGVTGSFNATTLSSTINISQKTSWIDWDVTNKLSLGASHTIQHAYKDSTATVNAASNFSSMSASIGTSISQKFEGPSGIEAIDFYQPTFGGSISFSQRNQDFQLSNGTTSSQRGFGGTLTAGLGFGLANGGTGSVNVNFGAFGNGSKTLGVSGSIKIPLN